MKIPFAGALGAIGLLAAGPGVAQLTNAAEGRLVTMNIEPTPAALVQFATQGDAATVDLLLAAGVAPGVPEPLRRASALHSAAAQGHLRLVEGFIALGVPVNAADVRGVTPLVGAASMGHLPVVAALLRAGAKPNVVPKDAPTALIAAIQAGNAQLVDALLAAGADAKLPDAFGTTPLEAARRARRQPLIAKLEAAK